MKKRIAIIIERVDIALGGAERSISELSHALSARGHDITLLVAAGRSEAKHIHILCGRPSGRTSFFEFQQALKSHLAQNKYDILHSVLPFDFADVYQPRGGSYPEAVAQNIASWENKLIQSVKKLTSFTNFRRHQLLLAEKKLCQNPQGPKIAALSQYVANHFKHHYALADDRIIVIPNGIKIDKHVDPVQTEHLKARIFSQLSLKQADNPVLFLFVANNFRLKGLVPLLKAMQIAGKDKFGKNACLLIAGSGNRQKYQTLAKKLNIQDRVTFLGSLGHIQNALAAVNVAVLPTFYDPASRFILEALAADLPVITTKFNGAADFYRDPRHGKIINDPRDIPALAAAICHFANPQNINSAAHNIAADNLKQNIDIDRAAGQLDLLYDSIIQSRRIS